MQRHPESPLRLKLQKGASINDVAFLGGGGVKNLKKNMIKFVFSKKAKKIMKSFDIYHIMSNQW